MQEQLPKTEAVDPSIQAVRDADLVKKWLQQVNFYEKEFEGWVERSKKLLLRYRDETKTTRGESRYNVFWSNVETLKPAIYARTPTPEVERKFKDSDPDGRTASMILERGTAFSVKEQDFDAVMKNVRDDYLRVGRGTPWVRYVPTMQPMMSNGQPVMGEDGQPVEEVAYDAVVCDYVHWGDFLHGTGRVWEEVTWVGKRTYLTRDEVKQQFGEEIAQAIQLTFLPKNLAEEGRKASAEHDLLKKAQVIEIWDRTTKKVYWVSDGYKEKPLRVLDDPLKLKRFFPCPRPLYATLTTDSLVPISDYCQYQDLCNELDELSTRENLLTEACRVAGVYDASKEAIEDLLSRNYENKLIPVSDWARFAQDGGFDGSVQFMPLKDIVGALQVLSNRKQTVKQEIYEITGLSDIIRGASGPAGVTATEQQLKGQFGTLRISDKQYEMQRIARDVIEIMAEIIAEHFQPQTLALISDIELVSPEDMQRFSNAVALLRNDALRSFRIGIETDSTINLDETQEKQDRNEFIQAVAGFMQQAVPAMQQMPGFSKAFGEMLLFLARGFKAGRSLENAIEEGVQATLNQIEQAQQQPPQPDPEQQAKADAVNAQTQESHARLQMDQQKAQQEMQIEQFKAESRVQIEKLKADTDLQIQQIKAQHDMEMKQAAARQKILLDFISAQNDQALKVRQQQVKEYVPNA